MALEGTLKFSGLELPDFDGTVFGGRGKLGVLRVKCKRGDVGLVSFEFVLGWFFEDIEFLGVYRPILLFVRQRRHFFLNAFIFLLKCRYFFL